MEPQECMFCHGDIAGDDVPENLAFMSHIEAEECCQSAFEAWTGNMQRDFLGD